MSVSVTERGVRKAEGFLAVDNLFRARHASLLNHLIQALKAESLYERGVDYEVVDSAVKMIDSSTGQVTESLRTPTGLRQALEAKEGLRIGPD